jgi:hypothetical protein
LALLALAVQAVAASGAPGQAAPVPTPLERYSVAVTAHIPAYRKLLKRLEALLTERPQVNVDPLVENLNGIADRFEDLDATWQRIPAPHGMQARHRGLGRAFVLIAEADRIFAAALYTRHPDEIAAASPKVQARFRSAAYLQYRWAAALQGALKRAGLTVPRWLHGMAALKP